MGFFENAKSAISKALAGVVGGAAAKDTTPIEGVLRGVTGGAKNFVSRTGSIVRESRTQSRALRQQIKEDAPVIQARRAERFTSEKANRDVHRKRFEKRLPELLKFTAAPGLARIGIGSILNITKELGLTGEEVEIPNNFFLRSFFGEDPIQSLEKRGRTFGQRASETFAKGKSPLAVGAQLAFLPIFAGLDVLPGIGGAGKQTARQIGGSLIKKYGDEGIDIVAAMRRNADLSGFDQAKVRGVQKDLTSSGFNLQNLDSLEEIERATQTKYSGSINKFRLGTSPKANRAIDKAVDKVRPQLEKQAATTLTDDEIIAAASQAEALKTITTKDEQLKFQSSLLKLRQSVMNEASGGGITKDLIEQVKVLGSQANAWSRTGKTLAIKLGPGERIQRDLITKLGEMGTTADEILELSKGVDFNDPQQATDFYRKFVKPKFIEVLDEARYINMLSSPDTHATNLFGNLVQAVFTAPSVKLAEGVIDTFASKLTGKQREAYLSEVPEFVKGFVNSIPDAAEGALDALRGKSFIQRPDLSSTRGVPTGSKLLRPFQFVTRALEAGDVFFRTIIESSERAALAERWTKSGKKFTTEQLDTEAKKRASYFIFRQDLKPKEQGVLLNKLDDVTEVITSGVDKIPGMRWVIPFIRTPTNILKQGLEFSPFGWATLLGAKNKREQAAKALVGSIVTASTAQIMMTHETSWALPENKKERDAFLAAGGQPYAIKFGDKWIQYSKLGPLAYPIALMGAVKHEFQQNPDRFDKKTMGKITGVMSQMAGFFSDQSYVQNLDLLVDLARTDWRGDVAKRKLAGNVGRQLVPLSALLGWASRIIDPVFRDADSIPEDILKNIPFLSKTVDPKVGPDGEPAERSFPFLNAVLPFNISKVNEEFDELLGDAKGAREKWNEISELNASGDKDAANAELQRLWDDNKTLYNAVVKEKLWEELGITKDERDLASMQVANGERSREIFKLVNALETREAKNALIQKFWDAGMISDDVNKQLNELIAKSQQ